ncbi:MAG: hypothetical protein JO194_06665 [Candidatus Eremiobacteraeota bacterium]|nr:hypothetical protein [Candidatus Eremiobacteraeota bacterium]
MKTALGVLGALAIVACAGCASDRQDPPPSNAPAIAGTLYVTHLSSGDASAVFDIVRDGALQRHHAASDVLIARDRPQIRISTKPLFDSRRRCQPMAISPHGIYVACMRSDDNNTIALFRMDRPFATLHDTSARVGVDTHQMVGFVSDDRLAVAADDLTCPAYYRTDAQVWSAQPRSRVHLIDSASGKTVRTGICVHGVITGDDQLVYLGHDNREDPQFSRDGIHWIPGQAVALDGMGQVLAISHSNDLVDEQSRVISRDVVDAKWTR